MSRLFAVLGLVLGLSVNAQAITPQSDSTSPDFPSPDFPSLRQAQDAQLQRALELQVKRLKLDTAVRKGRLAVALVDVTDPQHPALAQLNGDTMMYAASLPKIAILLAAFERAHEGKLEMTAENRQLLNDMIRYSSNTAATEMIRRVGRGYINNVLSSPKYRLYDASHNGGLWVGKEYASGVAYRRDPLHNISHGATATQVARFYYLLETGQLVSPEASREMKAMLGNPGIQHKFVKGLMGNSPEAQIYRKSGTWRDWHADSALIEHNGRTYIAVALAQSPRGGKWMESLICEMDSIILRQPVRTAQTAGERAAALPASDAPSRSSSSERLM